MTDNNHPITPPDELVMEWIKKHYGCRVHRDLGGVERTIATQSARWGADHELDACCERLTLLGCSGTAAEVRSFRRPKPPSLKEQALKELHHLVERLPEGTLFSDAAIFRAIESLPD